MPIELVLIAGEEQIHSLPDCLMKREEDQDGRKVLFKLILGYLCMLMMKNAFDDLQIDIAFSFFAPRSGADGCEISLSDDEYLKRNEILSDVLTNLG